jgi:hypothetical protein
MITTQKTYYVLANPKRPRWIPKEPADNVDVGFAIGFGVLMGLVVGMLSALIADAVYLNGSGVDDSDAATGWQVLPYFVVCIVLGMILPIVHQRVLPKRFPPTYFTNSEHLKMHKEYLTLSPAARSHAQDAYDALAAFNDASYSYNSLAYSLRDEAQTIWDSTYTALKQNESIDNIELHEDRVRNARNTLEAIKSSQIK